MDKICPLCECPLSEHIDGQECVDEKEICGRNMEVVNEYASTCDGCAELEMHEFLTMDSETQLGYCPNCVDEYIMNKGIITIVSGVPRSGTSMLMKMLQAGGIPSLTDGERIADEDNPNGYLELEAVKKTKEDDSWIIDAPGKAVKVIYRLLYDLPTKYQYKIIFAERDLREVISSQIKMLQRSDKKLEVSPSVLEKVFEKQVADCKSWLAENDNFEVLYVRYDHVLEEPLGNAECMRDFLEIDLNVEAMASVVDPQLYRSKQFWKYY